ncbi:hypothetical protein FQR65_LT07080 [Abscondita terminalis]|nr:hypothetical protein FQR65_LT07080 [Abscondita terminalis]
MIGFTTILLTLIVLSVIYFYKLAKLKPENFPPGPPRLPIWGSYWFLLLANYNFTHKAAEYLRQKYNSNLIGIYEGNYPVVIVTTHALAKEALSRDEFIGRPDNYISRNRSFGQLLGVALTDGPIWKEHRRFSLRQLRDYGFGRRFNTTERLYESEVKALIEFLQSDPNANDLNIIEQRKLTFSDDHKSDLLDSYLSKMHELLRDGLDLTSFTEKQLLWTIVDNFFPAPNIIEPSLSMLWVHLCMFPEVQVKVQEEIDRVVSRSRLPTLDDRKNMPYTEAVIRESLRFDGVVPINTPRRCLQDTTLGGYFIPENTILLISAWNANYDPKVWSDPGVFKPERFLNNEGILLKNDNILSFGGGKRLCVGETFSRNIMFLLLSGLLQNFTFKPAHEIPDRENKRWGFVVDILPFWIDAISR